jgi:hypothetical protein
MIALLGLLIAKGPRFQYPAEHAEFQEKNVVMQTEKAV